MTFTHSHSITTMSHRELADWLVRLCLQGQKYYQALGTSTKRFSIKKFCFEMSENYQVAVYKVNRLIQEKLLTARPLVSADTHVLVTYREGIDDLLPLSNAELIVTVCELEKANLKNFKGVLNDVSDSDLRRLVADIAAHIQTSIDKLDVIAESELKADYA